MKKTRFNEEQIIGALKDAEGGMSVADVCRKVGVSAFTFYKWKKRYSGLSVSEAKRMRELEVENSKLKRLVADQALDILALKEVVSKKW